MHTWTFPTPFGTATLVAVIATLLTSAMLWSLAFSANLPAAPRFSISVFALT